MPTHPPRIQVIEDPELARPLERARPLVAARGKPALLRALALRGAHQVIGEEARRRELLERLADWSTDPAGPRLGGGPQGAPAQGAPEVSIPRIARALERLSETLQPQAGHE